MTLIFVGVAFFITTILRNERRSAEQFKVKQLLVEKATELYTLLLEDESPECDHLFDKAWLLAQERDDLSLKDISSFLNPNWIEYSMLVHLNENMLAGESLMLDSGNSLIDELVNDYRYNNGPFANIKAAYSEYFSEDILNTYFTEYNYFNFNVTDQTVFRRLYGIRMGNPDAGYSFEEKYKYQYLQVLINERESSGTPYSYVHSAAGLENWFSKNGLGMSEFDDLFPLLNVEAVMNIHHVPVEILAGVLSHPAYGQGNQSAVEQKVKQLVEKREKAEKGLTPQDFNSILEGLTRSLYPGRRIFDYFGFITWFWEITAREAGAELKWIIARIPHTRDYDPEFKLLQEDFSFVQWQSATPTPEPPAEGEEIEAGLNDNPGDSGQPGAQPDGQTGSEITGEYED